MRIDDEGAEDVRCVDCRSEYQPTAGELACPDCGSTSWISARIPAEPQPQQPVQR